MKKKDEQETLPANPSTEPDTLSLLKQIQRQLTFLEKKVDTLIQQAPRNSFKDRSFSKPQQRSFGNSYRSENGRGANDQRFTKGRSEQGFASHGVRRESGFDRPRSQNDSKFSGKKKRFFG